MVMSYNDLVADKATAGSIKNWLNYSKIDSVGVLEQAQAMIYERLRVQRMISTETISVKVGAASVDLPDGFIAHKRVRDITNDLSLSFKEEADLEDIRTWTGGVLDSGDPAHFGIYDELINFDVATTTAWKARVLFYKLPEFLSESNPTNWLTKNHPHMVMMGCLAVGARFAKDMTTYQREQQLLFNAIDSINANDEMGRASDVPVRM